MKELSFYDTVGLVLPGSIVLFAAMYLLPDLRPFFAKDGLSVGGLGLFVLLSYALGHLVAGLGNLLEAAFWRPFGGMPSTWVIRPKQTLLSDHQMDLLRKKLKARLDLDVNDLRAVDKKLWSKHFGFLYRDVLNSGAPGRIETFNGAYGLNRGLAAAMAAATAGWAIVHPHQWKITLLLICLFAAYLYRMRRFGVYFAREVYMRFLLLPDARA